MPNETKELVKYQWIKGDNQGTVETMTDTSGKFIVFESGKRCSKEVIGEFMQKIDIDNPILEFDDPLIKVTTKPKIVDVDKEVKVTKDLIQSYKISSPIIPLLEKAKTKKTKLNTRIEMNLPSKEFLDVLQQSWDEDVLNIQAEYIVSQIEDPKQFLTDKIKMSLSDWFKSKGKGGQIVS